MSTGSGAMLIDAFERLLYEQLAANPPFLAEGDGMGTVKVELFDQLGAELDAESWGWLCEHLPRVADAVETAVVRGASPEAVRDFVLRRCGYHREELARRCESAARHLGRGE